jgi:hypothetical protein
LAVVDVAEDVISFVYGGSTALIAKEETKPCVM